MSGLNDLLALISEPAWAALLVFVRVGAAMAVLPGLGERMLSVRIRLILGAMLTVVILPALAPVLPLPDITLGSFAWAILTESVAGLFCGLALRLFILAIQTAGAIAAQSTSLSQLMGQAGVDPLPAIGHILTVAALALLMATGFHVKAAAFMLLSYELFPFLNLPDPSDIAAAGSARIAQSFALAFSLAAPFVILSVLYNLTLGVINKAMPQLMVAFVGAPVITLGAIALFFLSAPIMLTVWLQAVEAFLAVPFR